MPSVGFEPTISAGERPQTYVLDRATTGTGLICDLSPDKNQQNITAPRAPRFIAVRIDINKIQSVFYTSTRLEYRNRRIPWPCPCNCSTITVQCKGKSNNTGNNVQCNIEWRLCNHCCSGKAITIIQPECVCVALGMQHAMDIHHLHHSTLFPQYHKQHDFLRKVIDNKMYV